MGTQDTNHALAEITDEGLFERVAMSVLRIEDPQCVAVAHPGVNANGKTRKAPLNGIGFVPGANPPRLVAVHHTITAVSDLRAKWLNDPAKVKPRNARRKPTAPAGDLRRCPKTIASFRETSARCCSSILDGMSLGSC